MIRTNDGTQTKRLAGVGDKIPVLGISPTVITYVAAGGETSINLSAQTPPISYKPGQHQLAVRRSSGGGELFAGIDYTETSTTAIGFAAGDALIAGEIVEIELKFAATGVMAATPRPDCYTATATTGQTTVTADFSWTYNAFASKGIGAVRVYLHGTLQTRGVDYNEVNLGTSMTNQITFVDALLGGENIAILPTQQVIDDAGASTQFNNSRLTGMQSMISAGTQAFVDQSTDMISVPNTTIVGRAKIPNLANDLRASFGIERIPTQSIMQLQNEFGPNGEPVYAALNDDRGLIRFVGSMALSNGSYGQFINFVSSSDYIEIVFYGTGLNLLNTSTSGGRSYTPTIDGVTGSLVNLSGASVLENRNYSPNMVLNVATGLSLGIHTAKIQSSTLAINGIEILNANASGYININTGTAYANGTKIVKSSASAIAYNTGVTGVRGGRVVRYLNSDGTVGQAFTPTDAAAAYQSLTNHTNEEVVRTYHYREFGAGRNAASGTPDDFSITSGQAASAFTLDDGTTTLVATNWQDYVSHIALTTGAFVSFTFVGTGLDIYGSLGSTPIGTGYIDGNSIGVVSRVNGYCKICSGLAYGTHTFKIVAGAGSPALFSRLVVYGPKKPTIPATAVELCDYNVLADFASCTAGDLTVAAGVLRKAVAREMIYVGTGWSVFGSNPFGWTITTTVNTDYIQYTFFGTGLSYRFQNASAAAVTAQMTLTDAANPSGTTNFSGFTVATNGTGISSFVAATATLTTTTTNTVGNVISVSGMALGWHTIKITKLSGVANFFQEALDIITPIHAVKSNLYADLQNTLPVGSCSLTDSRKTSMIKEALPAQKAWAQAVGLASVSTSSGSPVPLPDMSVTIKTSGGPLYISYCISVSVDAIGGQVPLAIYVDGVATGFQKNMRTQVASYAIPTGDQAIVPVSAGVHKVDIYWFYASGGTAATSPALRNLTVQEL